MGCDEWSHLSLSQILDHGVNLCNLSRNAVSLDLTIFLDRDTSGRFHLIFPKIIVLITQSENQYGSSFSY